MNKPRHFTKYQLCKRCLKELPETGESVAESATVTADGKVEALTAAAKQLQEATHLPLVEQVEQINLNPINQLCASCQALAQLQANWKPFPLGASIGAIFFVPDKTEAKED